MNKENQNIVLIGFMGTGKTSIGKLLAKKLGYRFIDTDTMIEEESSKSITEIFDFHGEDYFRKLERDVAARVSKEQKSVISTGGGIVLNAENMQRLSSTGTIICLKGHPDVLLSRLGQSRHRPLLAGANPLELITKKLESRRHLYNGDLNLDTSFLSPDEVVNRIIAFLNSPADLETMELNAPSSSYQIAIGGNVLNDLPEMIRPIVGEGQILLVTSEKIAPLWGDRILNLLEKSGFTASSVIIPDGEEYKSFESAMKIYGAALERNLDRTSTIVAVGGGVIGDLAGFVASTYMRGIKVIQIPTTLLAQVDSSIGGKTAINHPNGKNMIGTFHQPSLVFSDTSTLTTLPKEEFINGMAEVIKYGVSLDKVLFEFLEKNTDGLLCFDQNLLNHIIKKCSFIKKSIVEQDEKEAGLRAILNYGHTLGHGVEAATNYKKYRHGEAVSIGMDFAAALALSRGILSKEDYLRQKSLLEAFLLPIEFKDVDTESVLLALMNDKKNENGKIRMILPLSIGSARLFDDITTVELRNLLKLS